MKKIIAMALLCNLLLGLVGCAKPVARTVSFALGEASFLENGTEITYPLDGVLGVPEGENNPVVFILHGAHPIEDVTEDRYYRGFSYLAEQLAEQGYLAISININRAYSFEPVEGNENERAYQIFQAYRELLEQANAGEKTFPVDLSGKADLTGLNFIGHSRGGDNGMFIAKRLTEAGESVRSVMLVASPLGSGYQSVYVDVPTAIVLPQYDGDVVGLDSNAIFAYSYLAGDARKTPVASAFLNGANHNGFNAELTGGDTLAPPQGVRFLAPEIQRDFLCKYATDFLNVCNRDDYDFAKTLSNAAIDNAGGMSERYGIDVIPSVLMPDRLNVLTAEASANGLTTQEMELQYVESSQAFGEDTAAPVKLPDGFERNIPLYRLQWSKSGARATLQIAPQDVSQYRYLSLYLAADIIAQGNADTSPTELVVEFTDAAGNRASCSINSETEAVLRRIETPITNVFEGMEGMPRYEKATFITPLGTHLLPLEDFTAVDLTQIVSMQLVAQSERGAILLEGIDFYR